MSKLRVFFSPTPSNKLVVGKLQTLGKLRSCEFIPLAEEWHERAPQLEKTARSRRRAVFLWGEGHRHHESYWFTRGSRIRAKINVDYHHDKERNQMFHPDCENHMLYTSKDGIAIFTPELINNISDCSLKRPTRMERFLAKTRREGRKFGINEVALTIDLDGLIGVPVLEEWIFHNGLQPEQVVGLLRTLGTRIFRLDIGGLVENMPDFELVDLPVDRIPKPFEVMSYLADIKTLTGEQQIEAIDPKDKPLINLIGSYTLDVYVKILGAYADVNQAN